MQRPALGASSSLVTPLRAEACPPSPRTPRACGRFTPAAGLRRDTPTWAGGRQPWEPRGGRACPGLCARPASLRRPALDLWRRHAVGPTESALPRARPDGLPSDDRALSQPRCPGAGVWPRAPPGRVRAPLPHGGGGASTHLWVRAALGSCSWAFLERRVVSSMKLHLLELSF